MVQVGLIVYIVCTCS